jgi:hypothetical protein
MLRLIISAFLITFGLSSLPTQAESYRYPTDDELKQLSQEFQQRIIPVMLRSRQYGGGKRSALLDTFTKAWSRVAPVPANFLGTWNAQEDDLIIYPSTVKNRVCVIWSLPINVGIFMLGSVYKDKIRITSIDDRGMGYRAFIGSVLIRKGNYLAIAQIKQSQPQISPFSAFSDPLKPVEQLNLVSTQKSKLLEKFYAAKCTASLP